MDDRTAVAAPAPPARENASWVIRCLDGDDEDQVLVDALAPLLVQRFARRGEALCESGRVPDGVWIVQDGLVELTAGPDPGRVVQTLCRGDVYGLEHVVTGRCTPCRPRAATFVPCLFVSAHDFGELLAAYPAVIRWCLSGLATRLLESWTRLAGALDVDVRARTARTLLLEARGGVLNVTQGALASMVGSSRPTLNRVVRELEERGLVTTSYRRIDLVDPAALRTLAAFDAAT
ncbi:Crp/Fnr family transcriptional regulator [Umezawaea beigongshangensis]|uniref:Crp/Fnr family transcriptional regulator n=1 Tax=Umezawaea beigongshangensis TaxID=2780383 RepID=UPI0018F199F2|nr:Crp/Fnr family transcriptional regulator [Umezawaea beigongshangensis]